MEVALHLMNDDIHHCHLIAQENEGVSYPPPPLTLSRSDGTKDPTADLLHATLHRREGQ